MRRGLLAGVLVLFALWFAWKAVPFLDRGRPVTYATPTVQPTDPASLAPVTVKGGQTACTDRIPWGPDARYVQFTVLGAKRRPTPAIRVTATGKGYRAAASLPAGAPGDALQTVAIAPAPNMGDGTLCLANTGRQQIKFYGINPGRGQGPSTTTIDGRAIDQELSITLLTKTSQSLAGRLGTTASRIAAFRPLTGWEVFLLGLLAALGVPVAVGVALSRAAAQDDLAAGEGAAAERFEGREEPAPSGDAQASARS